MINSTLCYIEKDGCYLMLLRNKKKTDANKGKWIGIGGKFEENESPSECVKREVAEETGLILNGCRPRGIVTFSSDVYECEQMFLFTADDFSGKLTECDEGTLKWIPKDKLCELNMWEGDRIFLDLIDKNTVFFFLKLIYRGDSLIGSEVSF